MIYKRLLIVSIIINLLSGWVIYELPKNYHMEYLRQSKYLLAFTKEIIIENQVKLNPDSKFMKGYSQHSSHIHPKHKVYLFDENKEIEIIDSKAAYGFEIKVNENNTIVDLGWYKP